MAIDYSVQYPCKVRDAVSDQELLRMEKARNRANAVLEIMRTSGTASDIPENERTVTVVVARPEGPVEKDIRIVDMLAEAAPLDALSEHCSGCPANLRNMSFGCGGAIHYPVDVATEEWLVGRLPESLDSPAGQLLTMALRDFRITGASIDACRSRGIIYSSAAPVVRTWGRFVFKKKITSSQILEMLFNVGSYQPSHARMMSLFLGFLEPDMKPVANPHNELLPDDGQGIAEFKLFLRAASYAGDNGCDLFIDA